MSKNPTPQTILGTGLIAMDAVCSHTGEYKLFAAGSCPNVFIILKTKGWESYPAGFVGQDPAASYLLQDFRRFGVDTRYIHLSQNYSTPVYVQNIEPQGHTFTNQCPFCKTPFRKFQPITPQDQKTIWPNLPKDPAVFYLERVTDYGMEWVDYYRKNEALIYFEPNRVDNETHFAGIAKNTHVLKYSHERRFNIHEITDSLGIPLEIETLGKEGLQFRVTRNNNKSEWQKLPAYEVPDFVDACGSGDWLSANLIHAFQNVSNFHYFIEDKSRLFTCLKAAQQQSAQNCAYEGARGMLFLDGQIQTGTAFCPACRSDGDP